MGFTASLRSIPIKRLHFVFISVAEQKECRLKWVQHHFLLDKVGQAVNRLSKIHGFRIKVKLVKLRKRFQMATSLISWATHCGDVFSQKHTLT